MNEQKFYSPLKIGLFLVTLSYFLVTFHALFTLSWIGEWEYVGGGSGLISFWIFVTDISGFIGIVFRFIASFIAFAAVIYYFAKKGLSTQTTFKVLRWVLVLEAIYWLGLLLSGIWGVLPVALGGFGGEGLQFSTVLLISTGVPCLVAAIAIPIALVKLASTLKADKPRAEAIKWGLIAGIVYIFAFWLSNTGMWISTLLTKGTEYVGAYPQNVLSFSLTVYGLPALAMFTAYFTGKSIGTEDFEKLNLRTLGVIVVALGLYFLWNYLTWIFFGENYLWSDWYAWFLGHNLDLWIISLPLVGLPLLFKRQAACAFEQS